MGGFPIARNPYAAAAAAAAAEDDDGENKNDASDGGEGNGGGDGNNGDNGGDNGGSVPPDFGQPHLFEWEVHGHRLLVESSLVVFQRERQTPMSLKLVDLNAERPNTVGLCHSRLCQIVYTAACRASSPALPSVASSLL
jgi:hypothetical protein